MAKVRDVMVVLERLAPQRYAFSFDKVGLQVGDPNSTVERGVVSLDSSLAAASYAGEVGAQMLISHHPLIFTPLAIITSDSHGGRTVMELVRNGTSFAAAHTNWDSARGGINDTLAKLFDLSDVEDFGTGAEQSQVKLVVFAPAASADAIVAAAAAAGAGTIGNYEHCHFRSPGTGSFRGNESSSPYIGAPGNLQSVPEIRIEMILPANAIARVSRAIYRTHPYEEPAVDFIPLAPHQEQQAGRLGSLRQPMTFEQLVAFSGKALGSVSVGWGKAERQISKLAVVGGAADSEWRKAQRAGADALLTGEVKQHVALEASEEGFGIIAAGHYATEHPGCIELAQRLREELESIEWLVFEPLPGEAGRPLGV